MKVKKTSFSLFRYQILPVDRHFHGDLFEGIKSIEDLVEKKNKLFGEALDSVKNFETSQTETNTKVLIKSSDFYLYRIAANRPLHREKKDFTEEELDHFPSLLVAIWNHPNKQLIAVQKRYAAFQHSETVARMVVQSVSKILSERYLSVLFEPLFEESAFWDIIENNEGKISSIKFELITPNMANISGALSDNLKEFAKSTNSTKNNVSIEAPAHNSLNIDQENQTLQGLVNYSSQGGGDISIKIAGMKRRVRTSKSNREIEIDELELNGSPAEVEALMKTLMP